MAETVMTYDEMVALLKRGGGFDIDTFERESRKDLHTLYLEHFERDMVLRLTKQGRIYRCAYSVKILFLNRIEGCGLKEVRRKYKKGEIVETAHPKELWTVRETRKRDEVPLACAVRGCEEEHGLKVLEEHLYHDTGRDNWPELHASTVYHNIDSVVSTEWYSVFVDIYGFSCRAPREIMDGETKIYLEPFSIEEEWGKIPIPSLELSRIR